MAKDNFNIGKFLKESVKNSYTNQVAGEEKKELINENFVGLSPINTIPPRDKENYELAFDKFLNEEIKSGDEMKVGSHKIVVTDPDLYSEKVKSLRLDLEDVGIDSSAKDSRYSKFIGDTFNKFNGDVHLNGKKINYDGNSQIEYIESHGFAIIPNDPSKEKEADREVKEDLELAPVEVDVEVDDRVDHKNHGIDDEGRMAKSQLYKIAKYAAELYKMMEDDTQLDAWVQAKLTKACDYIGTVKHYLEGEEAIDMLGEEKDDEHKG